MPWRSRVESVLAVVALVVGLKVVHELYRWVAYADERARLRELTAAIDSAGLRVVRTQLATDSLQSAIEALDRGLDGARRAVAQYEQKSVDGKIPERLYTDYRRRLDEYNQAVRHRNGKLDEWRAVVESNHAAADRYNLLADSMRAVAARMGDPYYEVPSPVELAVQHGIRPPGGGRPEAKKMSGE
jgi:hypothetical protein